MTQISLMFPNLATSPQLYVISPTRLWAETTSKSPSTMQAQHRMCPSSQQTTNTCKMDLNK